MRGWFANVRGQTFSMFLVFVVFYELLRQFVLFIPVSCDCINFFQPKDIPGKHACQNFILVTTYVVIFIQPNVFTVF